MREITSQSAATYLQSAGRVAGGEPVEVRELAGGVSNVVLLVTLPERGEQFVLKQARERLRVKDEWLCPVERIWREVEVLQICGQLIPVRNAECGTRNERQVEILVPRLLWEDRENYCYAMTAATVEPKSPLVLHSAFRTPRSALGSTGCKSVALPLPAKCARPDTATRL